MKQLAYFFTKLLLLLMAFVLPLLAQTAEGSSAGWWSSFSSTERFTLLLLLIISAVIVAMLLVLLKVVNTFIKIKRQEYFKEYHDIDLVAAERAIAAEKVPFFQQVLNKLADAVPVSDEADIMLHHDYDGIRELDNNLPPWWLYMFYGSIVFSFVYVGHYHVFGTGPLQAEEYQAEMELAAIQKEAYLKKVANSINEGNVTVLTDEKSLAIGRKIWMQKCVQCHLEDGGGQIGPNMTDQYWLHGGSIKDIFSTIKYGVQDKGMQSWQAELKPKEMQEVASFILTLQGATPANPKAPQGELYVPEKQEETAPTDSTDQDIQALNEL